MKVFPGLFDQYVDPPAGTLVPYASDRSARIAANCPGSLTHRLNAQPITRTTGQWTAPNPGVGFVTLRAIPVLNSNIYQQLSVRIEEAVCPPDGCPSSSGEGAPSATPAPAASTTPAPSSATPACTVLPPDVTTRRRASAVSGSSAAPPPTPTPTNSSRKGPACVADSTAYASITFRLRMAFSVTGTPGSSTRALFMHSLESDIASALALAPPSNASFSSLGVPPGQHAPDRVQRARIRIVSLIDGSVLVGFRVLPPIAGSTGTANASVAALVASFVEQVSTPSSRLFTGVISGSTDPVYTPQVIYGTMDAASLRTDDAASLYKHTLALSPSLTMSYYISTDQTYLHAMLIKRTPGWAGIAFNTKAAMSGGDAVVIQPGAGSLPLDRISCLYLGGTSLNSLRAREHGDCGLSVSALTFTDHGAAAGGGWTAQFTRPLTASDSLGLSLSPSDSVYITAAWGAGGTMAAHSTAEASILYVNLATGLLRHSRRDALLIAHAVLMACAWAVLAPAAVSIPAFLRQGITSIRVPSASTALCSSLASVKGSTGPMYPLRIRPGKWIVHHRTLAACAWGLSLLGFGVAVALSWEKGTGAAAHFANTHQVLGLVVWLLGLLQPVNAWIRPPKSSLGRARSTRRLLWELVHRGAGYCALVLAVFALYTGLQQAGLTSSTTGFSTQAWTWQEGLFVAWSLVLSLIFCAGWTRQWCKQRGAEGTQAIVGHPGPPQAQEEGSADAVAAGGQAITAVVQLPGLKEPAQAAAP